MPEFPDISLYLDLLRPRTVGARLSRARLRSPFLLRSVAPPLQDLEGSRVLALERQGKRIVFCLENELFAVFHLMIAGRFLWKPFQTRPAGKIDLAAFDFVHDSNAAGTLLLTEAGTQHRAMLHVVRGRAGLAPHDPGGLDPLSVGSDPFHQAITRENHTIKRVLTDPRLFSGIGNAYSDEILHAARTSPLRLTRTFSPPDSEQLRMAMRATLETWMRTLRAQFGVDPSAAGKDGFPGRFPGPGDITAFRPDFAVHGKFARPCPVCGSPVQRIVYAENETNYCATCQTGGKVLADRSMSRLLKDDWPRSIEDWERL